jgi:hypothetical protein
LTTRDVFRVINELDAATVETLGERLELRGSDTTFNEMRAAYFDQLPLASAQRVLDVGRLGRGILEWPRSYEMEVNDERLVSCVDQADRRQTGRQCALPAAPLKGRKGLMTEAPAYDLEIT